MELDLLGSLKIYPTQNFLRAFELVTKSGEQDRISTRAHFSEIVDLRGQPRHVGGRGFLLKLSLGERAVGRDGFGGELG